MLGLRSLHGLFVLHRVMRHLLLVRYALNLGIEQRQPFFQLRLAFGERDIRLRLATGKPLERFLALVDS